jgi:hypothetical protein
VACGPFGGSGGPPRAAAHASPQPAPATASPAPTGPAGVVLRPGPAGSYSLVLVLPDGRVVGPVTARLRTVQPTAGAAPATLPVVSTSASRVYYLDGDADVRFLARDGTTGPVMHVPGNAHSESVFAVSPDDTRIAVATLDASADAASMRLSVEDLAGGGNHVDLPAPTDAAMWPVGWHAGGIVLALGSVPTRNVADNPYGTFTGYQVVEAASGARLAALECDPAGPLTPAGTACLAPGGGGVTLQDFEGHRRVLGADGGQAAASAAAAPDGARVAFCCAAGQLQLWDTAGDGVRGLVSLSGEPYGWLDATHLLLGDPLGRNARVLDVTTGGTVTVPVSGQVVARVPGGL